MINLEQYRLLNTQFPNQLILMNFSGNVVQSCDSIFDTFPFRSQSLIKAIPFLDSIFHTMQTHVPGTSEIVFKKVESPFSLLPGIYDFTFSLLVLGEQQYILWTIFDKTIFYNHLLKSQQQRNESEIKKQLKK